jgi:hypothetical protein
MTYKNYLSMLNRNKGGRIIKGDLLDLSEALSHLGEQVSLSKKYFARCHSQTQLGTLQDGHQKCVWINSTAVKSHYSVFCVVIFQINEHFVSLQLKCNTADAPHLLIGRKIIVAIFVHHDIGLLLCHAFYVVDHPSSVQPGTLTSNKHQH